MVGRVGHELYELFFRGYTRKQWGLDPSELDKQVTSRIPTRTNTDDRYFTDTFQIMPRDGYTKLFEAMLDHLEHTPGALPLLQFALAELWERRDAARGCITRAALEETLAALLDACHETFSRRSSTTEKRGQHRVRAAAGGGPGACARAGARCARRRGVGRGPLAEGLGPVVGVQEEGVGVLARGQRLDVEGGEPVRKLAAQPMAFDG